MSSDKSKLNRFRNGFRGELWKQGKVIKKWKLRYFVLEQRRLRCYNDNNMDTLHAELIIDEGMQIYDVPEGAEEHNHAFFLVGKTVSNGAEEVFLLAANNEREKQEWIEALVDGVHDGFKKISQPELWPTSFYPTVELSVQFSSGGVNTSVENGNILRPFNTESAPSLTIKGTNADDRFCFLMVDIDPIPSPENANHKIFLHWGVVNFTSNDIRSGDELTPYLSPAPVYNSGLHRFFCLLFKQSKPLTASQLSEIVELFNQRDGFAFTTWTKRMNFTKGPAAINGFYAGWEEYCDVIHERIGYVPPEKYRSPTQESRVQREEDRRRLEQTKLALYKDLGLRDVFGLAEDDPKLFSTPSLPCAGMRIVYAEEANIVPLDGAVLTPMGTMSAPDITFEHLSMSSDYYTLIMTDPDAPSRLKPDFREFVHWVIVNIDGASGGDLASGEVVLPYLGPAPPYSSGLHRYVFTLYKQKDRLAAKDVATHKSFFETRGGLRTYQYLRSQSDQFYAHPIAMDAFLCEWEQIVDDLHEKMHWLPPDPFRSPKQKLQAMHADIASLRDVDKEKDLLKQREDAWDQEQYAKLKAAEENYRARALDIDLLALAAAARAADDAATNPSSTSSSTRDPGLLAWEGDDDGPGGANANAVPRDQQNKASLPRTASKFAHKKPVSFHVAASAGHAGSAEDDADFERYLQENAQPVDRSVVSRVGAGSVVVEELLQTVENTESRHETIHETNEVTRTIEITGGTTQAILERLDEELAKEEERILAEQVTYANQRATQFAIAPPSEDNNEKLAIRDAEVEVERQQQHQQEQERERERLARIENERLLLLKQQQREADEKGRSDREKAEAERLQRVVEEQQRIIEMQQQQQQLLLQQQQLLLQQQQQQQELLLQRSNSAAKRSADPAGDDDNNGGKRAAEFGIRPALSRSMSIDSDDNASHGSRHSSSVASNASRGSRTNPTNHHAAGSRPAVGIQRSPSMVVRDYHHKSSPRASQQQSQPADELDSMLQPGRSTVSHNNDYDDDATVTSKDASARPGTMPIPPPIFIGSPVATGGVWQAQPRQNQQASPSHALSNTINHSGSGSNPGTPSASLMRRANLNKTQQSQYVQGLLNAGSVDDSDTHSVSSAYTAGGTLSTQTASAASAAAAGANANNGKPGALLKQTTSMYLKSGAGTINQPSAQDALTAGSGLTPDEVRERLLDPATPTAEKCAIFSIASPSVFDGENVKKKFSKDFLAKDSFMWIDPVRKSLHWGKSAADKANPAATKFVNLDRVNALDSQPPHLRPQGEIKGLFKSLDVKDGTTITVTCENGDTLMMKMNDGTPPAAKRAADWAKMIRAFAS